MGRFRPIECFIWNDEKFPYSSDDCQAVWFHLFTNPLTTPIGLYKASLSGLAAEKNLNGKWPLSRYAKGFREAFAKGFVEYDEKALLVYFPNFFSPKHTGNFPKTPNVVKSWAKVWSSLPDSPLKMKCFHALKALLKGFDKAFMKAFEEGFEAALRKQPESLSPQEVKIRKRGSGSENQEQEGGGESATPTLPLSSNNGQPELSPQELGESWNAICGAAGLPMIELPLTGSLLTKTRARLREHPLAGWWEAVLNIAVETPFCLGRNPRGWRLTYDFVVANDRNAGKIKAGNYGG